MKVYSRKNSLQHSKVSKSQSQYKTPMKKINKQIETNLSTNYKRTNSQTQQKSLQNQSTSHKLSNSVRQIYSDRCEKSPLTKSCFTKLRKIRSIKQIQEYNKRQSIERYHFKSPPKSEKKNKQIQFPESQNKVGKNLFANNNNAEYMSANAMMKRKMKKYKKDKIALNIFALQDSIKQNSQNVSQNSFVVCVQ